MNFFTMDAASTAAWIALAVSILSPMLTSIINNHHQVKMKRIEIFVTSKMKIIEEYLSSAGHVIYYRAQDGSESYSTAIGKIYSAAPKSLWGKISDLDELIYSGNWEEAHTKFLEISQGLASHQPRI